jgi:nicotinate-nucleotide adenylyltransferase
VNEERLRRRIGIYGGTFDPVHCGHLAVAEAVSNAFALDRIFFVPAFTPPHKRKRTISSPFQRRRGLIRLRRWGGCEPNSSRPGCSL